MDRRAGEPSAASVPTGGSGAHWDTAYRTLGVQRVSWYQPWPTVSIELIRRLGVPADAALLDVGGGASSLAEALLADGFTDVSVLDLSEVALRALRRRLGTDPRVTTIHADLRAWTPERSFDLWHDRALFHFLVDAHDLRTYRDRLRQALRAGGHVVMGTFAPDGPDRCSGLPVARYSVDALAEALGGAFEVVEHRREEHVTPSGATQPFTWIAAQYRG